MTNILTPWLYAWLRTSYYMNASCDLCELSSRRLYKRGYKEEALCCECVVSVSSIAIEVIFSDS